MGFTRLSRDSLNLRGIVTSQRKLQSAYNVIKKGQTCNLRCWQSDWRFENSYQENIVHIAIPTLINRECVTETLKSFKSNPDFFLIILSSNGLLQENFVKLNGDQMCLATFFRGLWLMISGKKFVKLNRDPHQKSYRCPKCDS